MMMRFLRPMFISLSSAAVDAILMTLVRLSNIIVWTIIHGPKTGQDEGRTEKAGRSRARFKK